MNNVDEIKLGINNNYKMVVEFQEFALEEKDVIKRLKKIAMTGVLYSVLTTGVYSSEALEKEIAKNAIYIDFDRYETCRNNKILHVMTKGADYGGHSVIAKNWIKWDDEHISSLAFTGMEGRKIPSFLLDAVDNSGGEVYVLAGNYIEKAKKLLEISKEYEFIILHTHMYDVVPVLAYSHENFKTPVIFFNHADFRFSFGFSVSDVIVSITKYDIDRNVKYRGIAPERNRFLITPDSGNIGDGDKTRNIRKKLGIPNNVDFILSMGADYKYNTVLNWDFPRFVKALLKRLPEAYFYIIGADKDSNKWKKLSRETNGRARALGFLPKKDVSALMEEARLYISSFPMLASGAFLARRNNVPNLTLLTTGRAEEAYGENAAHCISELIKKAEDAWNGNAYKYLGNDVQIDFSKDTWKENYRNILKDFSGKHSIYKVLPNRIVGKQEIINYDMMQKDAINWVSVFATENCKEYDMFRKFAQLDYKYSTHISSARLLEVFSNEALCQEKIKEKLLKWQRVSIMGKSLADYLKKNEIYRVAIYGMGDLGLVLWDELEKNKIEVVAGIDIKADSITSSRPIVKPESFMLDEVAVINSTIFSNDDVIDCLKKSHKEFNVISLGEVLDCIINFPPSR